MTSLSFERYPLQVRHKQDSGRGFILLLPQAAALHKTDAGNGVIKPASRLRSRRLFVSGVRNLLDNLARLGIHASEWTNHKWKTEYCVNASRVCAFVFGTGARPVWMGLP